MSNQQGGGELVRALDWKGAFWVAAGVPPLVLFSIGGIAGTTGKLAFLVWMISMVMGFLQSFTYAEIAGMFGNKSGGASVYGATAWLRYSKFIAPLSVWCNWFAWSPVLSLGCVIAAGYILNALFPIPAGDSQMVLDYVAQNIASLKPDDPRVVEWLAANAGKTAEEGISALLTADGVAAMTHWIRGWEAYALDDPWPRQAALQFHLRDRRHPYADHLLDPAPRHCLDRQRPEVAGHHRSGAAAAGWPGADLQRLHRMGERHGSGAADGGLLGRRRNLEPWRLDALPWRSLHRRLVDLWLRDGGMLHARTSQSEDRHVQGHLLLGPPVHRLLLPHPLLLPGRARDHRACSRRGSSMAPE